jgi:hypothetical protein
MPRLLLLALLVVLAAAAVMADEPAAEGGEGKLKIGVKFRPTECTRKTEVRCTAILDQE